MSNEAILKKSIAELVKEYRRKAGAHDNFATTYGKQRELSAQISSEWYKSSRDTLLSVAKDLEKLIT